MSESQAGESTGEEAMAWPEVAVWRKAERERLIALRLDLPAQTRAEVSERIAAGLDEVIGDVAGRMVSFYWPFRGEPDLRPWAGRILEKGGATALPVIVAHRQPMIFRAWKRGEALVPGIWNIPCPAEGEAVVPDVIIAPLVGWDGKCYRLGHGGGFFDRTLASLAAAKPLVIGIGYAATRLETIHPQPHDIAMQAIVTEKHMISVGRDGP